MALPSAVTLASAAVVIAAGAGLAAAASSASEPGHPDGPAAVAGAKAAAGASAAEKPQGPPVRHAHGSPTRHSTPVAVPHVPVDVYNNSGVVGLAGDKTALLKAAGWNVASTDNWYGAIPADTVYFAPGLRQGTERLAAFLHVDRVHPTVSPMQYDRLTVIFTSG